MHNGYCIHKSATNRLIPNQLLRSGKCKPGPLTHIHHHTHTHTHTHTKRYQTKCISIYFILIGAKDCFVQCDAQQAVDIEFIHKLNHFDFISNIENVGQSLDITHLWNKLISIACELGITYAWTSSFVSIQYVF